MFIYFSQMNSKILDRKQNLTKSRSKERIIHRGDNKFMKIFVYENINFSRSLLIGKCAKFISLAARKQFLSTKP